MCEREEVRDWRALRSLAVDPFGDALVRGGAMPRYGLSLQDAHCVSRYLRSLGKPALAGLAAAATAPGPSASGREGVERLAADLKDRSEEHTSELQSLMRISYAVFCLKKKKKKKKYNETTNITEDQKI